VCSDWHPSALCSHEGRDAYGHQQHATDGGDPRHGARLRLGGSSCSLGLADRGGSASRGTAQRRSGGGRAGAATRAQTLGNVLDREGSVELRADDVDAIGLDAGDQLLEQLGGFGRMLVQHDAQLHHHRGHRGHHGHPTMVVVSLYRKRVGSVESSTYSLRDRLGRLLGLELADLEGASKGLRADVRCIALAVDASHSKAFIRSASCCIVHVCVCVCVCTRGARTSPKQRDGDVIEPVEALALAHVLLDRARDLRQALDGASQLALLAQRHALVVQDLELGEELLELLHGLWRNVFRIPDVDDGG